MPKFTKIHTDDPKTKPHIAKKYFVVDILAEVEEQVNIEDYDSIVSWVLKQPYNKIKFCVDYCADLPVIVKAVCSALLKDIQYGRIITVQMALERLIGKPIERQHIAVTDNTPLAIEVINTSDNEEIKKLCSK